MTRRLWVVVVLVVAALGFLVVKGLGDATTFFRNADEAMAERDELGDRRFRLQGTVLPGSLTEQGETAADFAVQFNCVAVQVRYEGEQAPPGTFAEGIPVVLEGHFENGSRVYRSDLIIVKHTSEYAADEGDRLVKAEEESCPTGATTDPRATVGASVGTP